MDNPIKEKKIVFLGTGKIAASLSYSLKKFNCNIAAVSSLSPESARSFAKKFSIPFHSSEISFVIEKGDFFILALPDDQIEKTANLIADSFEVKNLAFIHLSGALDSSYLKSLKDKGAKTGSVHIMQTFPDKTPLPLDGLNAAIETEDSRFFKLLTDIFSLLGLKSFRIDPRKKIYYHMMATIASNFMVGQIYNALHNAELSGLGSPNVEKILTPIILQSINNSFNASPIHALSGPVERGDLITIKKHIEALKNFKELKIQYIADSIGLLPIARKKNPGKSELYDKLNLYLRTELSDAVQKF